MENVLNVTKQNLDQITNLQIKIINSFVSIIALDVQKHVLDGGEGGTVESTEGKTNLHGHILAVVERATLACSSVCGFMLRQRSQWTKLSKLLFQLEEIYYPYYRPRWAFKSTVYLEANISVSRLSEVSILIEIWRANSISAGCISGRTPADCLHLLPNCCDFSVIAP